MTSPATYPLAWPEGVPRGTTRAQSPFRIALPRAVADLEDALHLFGTDTGLPVTSVVISSDVTLGASRPADQGVAVYFDWDGARRCIAIDRFALVEANVWAIYLILEGRRQELRHGGIAVTRAALQGFAALINSPITNALDAPATAAQRP